jgi:hypothetical protein
MVMEADDCQSTSGEVCRNFGDKREWVDKIAESDEDE